MKFILKKNNVENLGTVFTLISAAALIKFFTPQMQHLFEGRAYLKIGCNKEIFSFNLTVYFLPECMKVLQLSYLP